MLNCCLTTILTELWNAVDLMASSITNIIDNFLSFFWVRHRSGFVFIWSNDIVVYSRIIEHVRTRQKFIRFKLSVDLSGLSLGSISFLLNFINLRIFELVIHLNLWAPSGIQTPIVKLPSIPLHCFACLKYLISFLKIHGLCIKRLVKKNICIIRIIQRLSNCLWKLWLRKALNVVLSLRATNASIFIESWIIDLEMLASSKGIDSTTYSLSWYMYILVSIGPIVGLLI